MWPGPHHIQKTWNEPSLRSRTLSNRDVHEFRPQSSIGFSLGRCFATPDSDCPPNKLAMVDLSLYRPRFHVQSSGTASRDRRDYVVKLAIGHPMGSLPPVIVSLTTCTSCPAPISISVYARVTRFDTSSSFSSSFHQPTECCCGTIEDPCRALRHCL